VAENGVTATVTVTRVGGSFGAVGVDYASADVSATAGSDYTAVSGQLSFADGVTSQSFSIDILDDAAYEADESLQLSLSKPTGGAGLGIPAISMIVIANNDTEPVNNNASSGGGGGSIGFITLILMISLCRRSSQVSRKNLSQVWRKYFHH
jgi:hypothetical protein